MFKETLNKLIPLLVRQSSPARSRRIYHERNQTLAARPKFIGELIQHFLNFSDKIV